MIKTEECYRRNMDYGSEKRAVGINSYAHNAELGL